MKIDKSTYVICLKWICRKVKCQKIIDNFAKDKTWTHFITHYCDRLLYKFLPLFKKIHSLQFNFYFVWHLSKGIISNNPSASGSCKLINYCTLEHHRWQYVLNMVSGKGKTIGFQARNKFTNVHQNIHMAHVISPNLQNASWPCQ